MPGYVYVPGPGLAFYASNSQPPAGADYIVSMTIQKVSSGSARLGPAARVFNGNGVWAFYDLASDVAGLATISGGSATVLATTGILGVPVGGSLDIALWTAGNTATLTVNGSISISRSVSLDPDPGQAGFYGDGVSTDTTGLHGTFIVGFVPNRLVGTQADVITWLTTIIPSYGLVSQPCCYPSIYPEPFPYCGPPMVIIRSAASQFEMGMQLGNGRWYDGEVFNFGLTVVTRSSQDHPSHDSYGLTNGSPPIGLDSQGRALIDILHLSFPRSPSGDYLTSEPLTLSGGTSPPRIYRKNRGWRVMDLVGRVTLGKALTNID